LRGTTSERRGSGVATGHISGISRSRKVCARDFSRPGKRSEGQSHNRSGNPGLGGQTYLTIRDREQQGRGYSFHHGRPNGSGGVFWSFTELPDKERVEITKERDIAELYVGKKGMGDYLQRPRSIEQKDLDDYLRRRRFSLDTVLRTWINDPSVVLLFEGPAVAAQHPATQITLINSQNEASPFTSIPTPTCRSRSRSPGATQSTAEESRRRGLRNYRQVSGVMAPYNLTRYFKR